MDGKAGWGEELTSWRHEQKANYNEERGRARRKHDPERGRKVQGRSKDQVPTNVEDACPIGSLEHEHGTKERDRQADETECRLNFDMKRIFDEAQELLNVSQHFERMDRQEDAGDDQDPANNRDRDRADRRSVDRGRVHARY